MYCIYCMPSPHMMNSYRARLGLPTNTTYLSPTSSYPYPVEAPFLLQVYTFCCLIHNLWHCAQSSNISKGGLVAKAVIKVVKLITPPFVNIKEQRCRTFLLICPHPNRCQFQKKCIQFVEKITEILGMPPNAYLHTLVRFRP